MLALSKTAVVAVLLFAASKVHGHMTMKTPTPFGKNTLNNSPLDASGSDYPCKQRPGVYDASGVSNTVAAGSNLTVTFSGSAVHGGGSCQFSITTDKNPDKNTKWQVIESHIGSCPKGGVNGNLPADPNGDGADPFPVQIPSDIAAGDYVFAWTWNNRIGNREMYMNCAPLTVTGGGGPHARRDLSRRANNYPDLFKANIGTVSGGCATVADKDVEYPDPGPVKIEDSTFGTAPPTGNCGGSSSSGSSGGSSSGGSGSAGSASTSGSSSANAAPRVPANGSPSPSSSPAASTAPASPSSTPASPASSGGSNGGSASDAGASSGSGSGSGAGSGSSGSSGTTSSTTTTSSTGGTQNGACSNEGTYNCLDGKTYQRCASGVWSVVMPVAPGTTCKAGMADTLVIS